MNLEPKISRVRQKTRELVTAVAAAKQAAAEVTAVATSGDMALDKFI